VAGSIGSSGTPTDSIGNQTLHLPAYSIVPQPMKLLLIKIPLLAHVSMLGHGIGLDNAL
jgi:hypothetical protein